LPENWGDSRAKALHGAVKKYKEKNLNYRKSKHDVNEQRRKK